jgi:hypothetical protein
VYLYVLTGLLMKGLIPPIALESENLTISSGGDLKESKQ